MKEKHIILRSLRPATRDVFRGGAAVFDGLDSPPGRLSIEVGEISRVMKAGPLSGLEWMSRLIGSATRNGLAAGFAAADIGAGLIRAPQA
jgi:hypothetical protein